MSKRGIKSVVVFIRKTIRFVSDDLKDSNFCTVTFMTKVLGRHNSCGFIRRDVSLRGTLDKTSYKFPLFSSSGVSFNFL